MILNIKLNNLKVFNLQNYPLNSYPYFINFFQIIIGVFVSGLDVEKIYQTWPLMVIVIFHDIVVKNFALSEL